MAKLQELLGIKLPIIQAPMAGVQDSRLTVAVCNAGGLGSLPGAMLSRETLRSELLAIKRQTDRPFNVNFFCHVPPKPDAVREAQWKQTLAPYYQEFGIVDHDVPAGPQRAPFGDEAAQVARRVSPRSSEFSLWLASARAIGSRT